MTSQTEFLDTVENWAKLYFFQSLTEFFNYQKHSDLSLLQAYALTYLFFKGPIKISELCEHMMVSPGAAGEKFMQESFEFSQSWLSEIPSNITPEQEVQITAVLSILMQSTCKSNQPHLQK